MKQQPTVLFAYAIPSEGIFSDYLGSASIIAFLKSKRIRAEQFHSDPHDTLQRTIDRMLASGARVVGFTCYNSNYQLTKIVCRELKKRAPRIHLLAGGPTAMYSDAIILHNIPEISICVRGDGEFAMNEIMEHIEHGRPLNTILGISYRENGTLYRTPDRPPIPPGEPLKDCLDRFPSPYLSGTLDPLNFADTGHEIPLTTSRGCVFMCAYCNCPTLSHHGVRFHSPERVVAELKLISERLKGREAVIKITDDCFTLNKQRVREICEGILKHKIKVNITLLTRVDCVDTPTLKLLYRAGVRTIGFGLESAQPATLSRIEKVRRFNDPAASLQKGKEFIEAMKRCVKEAHTIGFDVYTSMIAGLPGETLKDVTSTLRFIEKLGSVCYYNRLRLFPGTPLFKQAVGTRPHLSEKWLQLTHTALPGTLSDRDIRRVPIMPNSDLGGWNELDATAISFFLMGLAHEDAMGRLRPAYFVNNNLRLSVSAIAATLPMTSVLLFSSRNKGTTSVRPIRAAYAYTVAEKRAFIDYTRVDDHYRSGPVQLHDGNKRSLPRSLFQKGRGLIQVVDLDSDNLAAQFQKLLGNLRGLSRRLLKDGTERIALKDVCRWTNNCPAKEGRRYFIQRGNRITCCFHGKILGGLGDPMPKILATFDKYLQAAQKERGCATCPVRKKCSQCPFLGDMRAETFCSLRKQHNDAIEAFMRLLKLHFRSRPAA
jgi:radical SAM superfamily enzyme YgiQ (UPF0313 family)